MRSRSKTCLAIGGIVLSLATGAAEFTSFKVLSTKGTVLVQTPGATAESAIEQGKSYPFGTTIKTDRKSSAVLELSPENTFRLLAKTTLQVTQNVKHRKLIELKLDTGRVTVTLDDFPKDMNLTVESPMGVCAAVGTVFTMYYEIQADGQVNGGVSVERGSTSFDSASVNASQITAGGDLRIVAAEGDQSRIAEITWTGTTPIKISLGLNNEIILQPGAKVRIAMPNTGGGVDVDNDGKLDAAEDINGNGVLDPGEDRDGDGTLDVAENAAKTNFVAVSVLAGTAASGDGTVLTTQPKLVSGNTVLDQPATPYFNAAVRESTAGAAVRAIEQQAQDANRELTPAEQRQVQNLQAQQTAAQTVLGNATPQVAAPTTPPAPYVPPVVPEPPQSPGGI